MRGKFNSALLIHMRKHSFICLSFIILLNTPPAFSGEQIIIEKKYLNILPHGRTTGSMLENWIAPVIFQQVETGGLSRVDSPRFSSRGISWVEQNYRLNGVDITDPFRSGYPLFEPAWESINKIELRSTRENDPYRIGLNWKVDLPENSYPFQVSYNSIFPTGGGSLIPEGEMDREPSFPFGSAEERRRYILSSEIDGSYNTPDIFYCGIETLMTRRKFPSLINDFGNFLDEKAGKYTMTMIYGNDKISMPYKFLLISQYNQNNNYGANLRLDNNETLTQQNLSMHLQYNAKKKLSSGKLDILSGVTAKFENLESNLTRPGVIEFGVESGPAPEIGDINRINFDNNLSYSFSIFNIKAMFQMNAVMFKPEIPYLQTMHAINDNIYSVTIWDEPEECDEFVYNGKLKAEFLKIWGFFSLSGNIVFDDSAAIANGKNLLNWFGIGGKILSMFSIKKSKTTISMGLLRQPSKLNSYITGFLDTKRPSGKTYMNWTDLNGNGIADNPELAAANLLSTTGGKYHYKDNNLKRPYHDEFSIGIEQPIVKHLKILLQGSHRIFSNYFIVNYQSYGGDYTSTTDGYLIYNKPPGADEYYLSNYTEEKGFYSGAEIQLLWEGEKVYFNFMFTAFMVSGFAPIGNGPDFNDYAVISENTADPNNRINASGGRLDSDRAYKANILFGYQIAKDLSFGLTLKYRDGEPFAQHATYSDSNGIPVMVITRERGNWDNKGLGRYTFAWNLDSRLRYSPEIYNSIISITLDVYNILGSSTEIIESGRIEDKRRALEAVPPRMIKLGIAMLF